MTMFNIPAEYQALAVYAIFVFLIFACALIWSKYRKEIKRRIPLINYEQKNEESPKITHHA